MRVLAQSAHRPSRVHPSKLENVNRMQCLSRVPLPRAAQRVVCAKPRAPPQLRVADQHLGQLRVALRSCPSSICIAAVLLPRTAQQLEADPLSRSPHRSTARVLSSDPRVPTTLAVSSPEDRSTAGNRPSVTVSFSEDRCLLL